MNFKFSKELIDTGYAKSADKQWRLYKVLDEQENILGQYSCYLKERICSLDDKELSIEVVSKFLMQEKHLLVDKANDKQVGEYHITGKFGVHYFWNDTPSTPAGTIDIAETVYYFRRTPPEVQFSIWKKDTWGYFKFILYDSKGKEYFEYALKMDIPNWSKPNMTNYRPFTGTIETNSNNILVMLAGLYLMELEFEYEDRKD